MITTNPNYSPENLTPAEKVVATTDVSDLMVLCTMDEIISYIWKNHKDKDINEELTRIVNDIFNVRCRMSHRLTFLKKAINNDAPYLKWAEAMIDLALKDNKQS